MRKIYLFLIIILGTTKIFSQTDEQENRFKTLKSAFFNEKSEKEKLKIADQYMDLAIEIDSKLNIAKANYMLANHYNVKNENEKALSYYNKSILFSKDLDKKLFPVVPMTEKSYLLYKMRRVNEALESFFIAEKYAKKLSLKLSD
jgi:hypothetical protein